MFFPFAERCPKFSEYSVHSNKLDRSARSTARVSESECRVVCRCEQVQRERERKERRENQEHTRSLKSVVRRE